MIRTVNIENYKSIPSLRLDLGRLTVLIGANGSGKSNLLEAIALASAAAQNKLDNEFLISRGIRVAETRFMRSAFESPVQTRKAIQPSLGSENELAFEAVRAPGECIRAFLEGDNEFAYACELFPEDS